MLRIGTLTAAAAVSLIAACGPETPEQTATREHEAGCIAGTVSGAVLGAAVGSLIGGGTGQIIAGSAGGGMGAMAGSRLTCG